MCVYNVREFISHFVDSLFPGYLLKCVTDLFKGMRKSIGMVLIKLDVQPFTTGITLSEWVILIASNLDYLIILDPNLEPAQIASQYTVCLFPVHFNLHLIPLKYIKGNPSPNFHIPESNAV